MKMQRQAAASALAALNLEAVRTVAEHPSSSSMPNSTTPTNPQSEGPQVQVDFMPTVRYADSQDTRAPRDGKKTMPAIADKICPVCLDEFTDLLRLPCDLSHFSCIDCCAFMVDQRVKQACLECRANQPRSPDKLHGDAATWRKRADAVITNPQERGQYLKKAVELCNEALELDSDHVLACCLLSECYKVGFGTELGMDVNRALVLLRRAADVSERTLGPSHPDTARSITNLACMYQDMGNLEAALPLFTHALAIHERVLGPNHACTAGSLNDLSSLYQVCMT